MARTHSSLWMVAATVVSAVFAVVRADGQAPEQPAPAPPSLESSILPGYEVHGWTTNDGLPQNSITSIAQTRDGYLWLGTFSGLVRFDGVRFKTFDFVNAPDLGSNRITALSADDRGGLWIGTEDGVVQRYGEGAFSAVPGMVRRPGVSIMDIVTDADGAWILAAQDGLYRADADGSVQQIPVTEDPAVGRLRAIHAERDGGLLIAGTKGVMRYRDGSFAPFALAEAGDPGLRTLVEDAHGNLWIGATQGLMRVAEGRLEPHDSGAEPGWVVTLLAATDGSLWLGGSEWVGRLEPERHAIETRLALSPAERQRLHIRSMTEDREGNIWVGTDGNGLFRIRARRMQQVTCRSGGVERPAYDFVDDVNGHVILAFADVRGLWRWVDARLEPFHPETVTTFVRGLATDAHGGVWVCDDQRLLRIHERSFTAYDGRHGLPAGRLGRPHVTRNGDVWVGGAALYRLEGEAFVQVPDTPPGEVWLDAGDGAIWFVTADRRGVGRIDDDGVRLFGPADGLGSAEVRSMAEDDAGVIWVGTYGGGLVRVKDDRCVPLTQANGLCENVVSSVLSDGAGRLWMNGNQGVCAAQLEELNAVADGRLARLTAILLPANEGYGSGGHRASDGRLWFGTVAGFEIVDPTRLVRNMTPPSVAIESVETDGTSAEPRGPLRIHPGQRDMRIRYTGLSFVAPSLVRFRYKLEGYDRDWIDAGTRREAEYTNLPPGAYRFRVTACNNDQVWNDVGASFDVEFLSYAYETTWFWIGCAVVTATCGYAGYRARTRSILRRNAELESQIAERQRVESALRASESQYRDFIATNLAGVWRFELSRPMPIDLPFEAQTEWAEREMTIAECNDVFARMYGFDGAADLIGRSPRVLWGDGATTALRVLRQLIESGYQFDAVVTREVLRSGTPRHFLNLARSVIVDGRLVRVWGTQVDVTEQMLAQSRLRESESRHRALVENIPGTVFRCESVSPRRVRYVGESIEALCGGSGQATSGERTRSHYTLVHPDDRAAVEAAIEQALAAAEPYQIEYRIETADGRVRWVREHGRPIAGNDDKDCFIDGVLFDITEARRVEEERLKLVDQLRQVQKLEAVGTLAAGIAHDVRNVLTAVLGSVDVAETCRGDEGKLLGALDDVRSAATECGRVVDSLVTFTRRESSQMAALDLAAVVRRAIPLMRPTLPDSIKVTTDVRAEQAFVWGNASHLHQVLLNLALNARDAMPDGGTLRVSLDLPPTGGANGSDIDAEGLVRLIIEDTGVGMPRDVRERAFEPFFTTKTRERGTGLGLAMVHGIIQEHRGDITIDSHVGRGTRFTITLPRCRPPSGGAEPARDPRKPPVSRGLTVLLIEDHAQVRAVLVHTLVADGFHVLPAEDGEEGLLAFEQNAGTIDLVIVDMDLPKISGPAVVQRILQSHPNLPIIAITGSDERLPELPVLTRGAVLRKPFSLSLLTSTAAQLLVNDHGRSAVST